MKLQGQAPITPVANSVVDDVAVINAEHQEISDRRRRRQGGAATQASVRPVGENESVARAGYRGAFDTIGLALSGGGVRSAAFCTGAMQGLQHHNVLDRVDYLSTVSGGGYAGAAVSLSYAEGNGFPFLKGDEKRDTPAMALMRDNANYLKFGQFKPMMVNLVVYLRGVVANILIVAPVLLMLAAVTLFFNPSYDYLEAPDFLGVPLAPVFGHFTATSWLLLLALSLFGAWALSVARQASAGIMSSWAVPMKWVLIVVALAAFFELQTFVILKMIGTIEPPKIAQCGFNDLKMNCLDAVADGEGQCPQDKIVFSCSKKTAEVSALRKAADAFGPGTSNLLAYATGVFAAISALTTMLASVFGKFLANDEQKSGFLGTIRAVVQSKVLWLAVGLALPVLFWLVYLNLVYWGINLSGWDNWIDSVDNTPWPGLTRFSTSLGFGIYGSSVLYFVLALLLALSWIFLTANGNSPHRLYRERLGQAFCFVTDPKSTTAKPVAMDCSDRKLSELKGHGPYHLINTALNIGGDPAINQRGRNADFFLLSPLFVGSKSTGYVSTELVERSGAGRNLSLATAIAVSGAAFSSNMGSATIGLMRLTFAFFNVRLGYWFQNPKAFGEKLEELKLYFLDEIMGRLRADSEVVYLSDGGHVENLGLYELLRRRCQLIIVVDAEADPGMNFNSFVAAQRYARIDLGARITMKWGGIAAQSLLAQKNSGTPKAGPHCAIGTIDYEGNGKGYILYIKSSVTGDENDYVRDYNRRFIAFPHESTSDQFFSEEQFEAYRALGFHCADGVLSGAHVLEDVNGGVSQLTDAGATADGISMVAKLLGVTQTSHPRPPAEPPIQHVKLVSEATQPIPVQLTVMNPQELQHGPVPPKRGRKRRGSR